MGPDEFYGGKREPASWWKRMLEGLAFVLVAWLLYGSQAVL